MEGRWDRTKRDGKGREEKTRWRLREGGTEVRRTMGVA